MEAELRSSKSGGDADDEQTTITYTTGYTNGYGNSSSSFSNLEEEDDDERIETGTVQINVIGAGDDGGRRESFGETVITAASGSSVASSVDSLDSSVDMDDNQSEMTRVTNANLKENPVMGVPLTLYEGAETDAESTVIGL